MLWFYPNKSNNKTYRPLLQITLLSPLFLNTQKGFPFNSFYFLFL